MIQEVQKQTDLDNEIERRTNNNECSTPGIEQIDELDGSQENSFHKLDYDNRFEAIAVGIRVVEKSSDNVGSCGCNIWVDEYI